MPVTEDQIFRIVGEAGFDALVSAFYAQVPADPVLGKMYPRDDLLPAQHRLRDFLIQRFGGPGHYSAARGHPRLRMRHAPFRVNLQARDAWLTLMNNAMNTAKFSPDVQAHLRQYFREAATFLLNAD